MKKISLIFTFVVLCVALLAMTAFAASFTRGPENDQVLADDVASIELISGSTHSAGYISVAGALDGNFSTWWGGPNGSAIKITLVNEWEITAAEMIVAANWCSCKVSFYAADDTLLGSQSYGGYTANTGLCWGGDASSADRTTLSSAVGKIAYGDEDKAVKYIVYQNTGDKWGYLPMVAELILGGRERVPSVGCDSHEFAPVYTVEPSCTTTGTVVNTCTKCGAEEAPATVDALGHNMGEYTVKVPATCDTAAVLEYACTRCGEVIERPTHIKDVTDYADIYTAGAQGAGGYTTSHQALYDNNMDSYLHASGQWYVESWIELDMPYYITSVTVWTGSWGDNNSWEAYFTFYYQAPGSDEWTAVSTKKDAGVIKAGAKYEHTLELAEPVYADAVKIKVDRLASFQGQAWEAEVAGTLFPETAPLGHTWEVTEVVAAACDAGYTLSTCTVCGETKTDAYTKAVGHIWADATCVAPKTCTVCTLTDGDLNPDAHNYVAGEQDENGAVTWTCENGCGSFYVINNSAINGEYYMGTDKLVFNNGTLTAMGNEYTYTYNVTTGMIDTNDAAINFKVEDGIIYFKGAERLHQHTGEGYIAEEQADGSINYICQFCGNVMYVVNNAAVNGEYYLGTDLVVFNNGVLSAMGEEFTYTYNVTTGMIDTNNAMINFTVREGVIYYKDAQPLHQHTGEGYIAEEQADGSINYVCPFCGNVMYVVNNAAINGTYYADMMTSFVFENGVLTANGETYNYTFNVTTGTLTVEGLAEGMLAYVNGKLVFRGRVELHQHNETTISTETEDATCTANGSVTTICQFCGPISVETIEATGHAWSDWECEYQPANCKNDGFQDYFCENCGVTKREVIPADENEHQEDYSVESEYVGATCKEEGYYKFTCRICQEVITNTLPIDTDWGHDYVTLESWDVTCQKDGYVKLECSLCGDVEEYVTEMDPEFPAHVWGEGEAITGGYHYVCSACGEEKTEITQGTDIDPIEAELGDNEVVYYVEDSIEVFFYYEADDAGVVTLTVDAAAGVKMGYNPYMMSWEDYMTGSTTYTFEMTEAGRCLIAISLDTETYTIPETFNVSFAGKVYPELEIGDNNIEIAYWGQEEYVVSVPGDYVLTIGANTAILVPDMYGYSMIEEYPYEFTVAEGEKVKFIISTENYEADTVTVTLASKNAHVHTEEIIPAVPGELRNPGMTSGVKCSVCGEIIVEPVQASGDFRFAAMNISLGESVSGVYKISVPNGYTNVYVEFDFLDEKTIVTDYEIEASSGRYIFIFNRTRLQSMADLVTATVYGTTIYRTEDGKEYEIVSANSYSNNSVKAFIVNQLKSSKSSAELKTMLSDLLVLGAKTQTYINYKADELMTADVVDLLTPSTYSSMAASSVKMDVYDAATRNIADWKAANIEFSDAMAAILKLQIDPAELENIEIRITIPGVNTADQVVTYTAKDLVFDEGTSSATSDDRYVLTVPNIKALLYGKAIKGEIYHNGVQISRVVNYSVNNFLYANRDSTQSDAHREWIRAVYLYGESVYAYNESQK